MAKSSTNTQLTRKLAKAERETQIQEAQDRVRTKALAMQTTEDIGQVVVETRDALIDLGIRMHRVMISLHEESKDEVFVWLALGRRGRAFNHSRNSLTALRKAKSKFFAPGPKRKRWVLTRLNKRELTSEYRKIAKSMVPPRAAGWVEALVKASPIPYCRNEAYPACDKSGNRGLLSECLFICDTGDPGSRYTETNPGTSADPFPADAR